jgi:hypothetical protein
MNRNIVQRRNNQNNVRQQPPLPPQIPSQLQPQPQQQSQIRQNNNLRTNNTKVLPPQFNQQQPYSSPTPNYSNDSTQMQDPNVNFVQASKMSIQNAITLITLRLGRIETLLQKFEANNIFEKLLDFNNNENTENIENNQNDLIIDNILVKIDTLESNFNKETTDLSGKIITLESNFNKETADLSSKITTLETSCNKETSDLSSKIITLETSFNKETSDLSSKIITLETSCDKGNTDLSDKITSIMENNTSIQTYLSNLNNDLLNIKNELSVVTNNNITLTQEFNKLFDQINNQNLNNNIQVEYDISSQHDNLHNTLIQEEVTEKLENPQVSEMTDTVKVIQTTENIVDEEKKTLDFSNIL